MKQIILSLLLLLTIAATGRASSIQVIYPDFDEISLSVQKHFPRESSVTFATPAAFTKELSFSSKAEENVLKCAPGRFDWNGKTWRFAKGKSTKSTLFRQFLIIYNGKKAKYCINAKEKHKYKALCEKNGKLCIIIANENIAYEDFVSCLVEEKVKHAIYLDTGFGWDAYVVKNDKGKLESHNFDLWPYYSNFLCFKKN